MDTLLCHQLHGSKLPSPSSNPTKLPSSEQANVDAGGGGAGAGGEGAGVVMVPTLPTAFIEQANVEAGRFVVMVSGLPPHIPHQET